MHIVVTLEIKLLLLMQFKLQVMLLLKIKQLLKELESFKPDQEGWIKTPRGLGEALRRLGPALWSVNIYVKIDSKPQRDGYHVHLNWIESEDEDE